jgi:hypothetical protein
MVDFRKDAWIYGLLAAILAIIAIFTPMGSEDFGGGNIQYGWLGGYITYTSGADVWAGLLTPGLYLFGVTVASATLLLMYSLLTWRGKEFNWTWLVYLLTGFAMVIFTIFLWVFEPDPDVIPISPIIVMISGIVAVGGGLLDKMGE